MPNENILPKIQIANFTNSTDKQFARIHCHTNIHWNFSPSPKREMQRDSDGKMKKWERDCKWSTDCESECNVCGIISLIEFSKAIVLVVILLGARVRTHRCRKTSYIWKYNKMCGKMLDAMWMQISGFVSLKTLRMYLWSSGSELRIGTHLSFPFFSPFERSSGSSSSCRSFTIILSCVHNYLRFCGRVALLPLCQWTMGRATQHAHAYTHKHASIHRMNEWNIYAYVMHANVSKT